MVLVVYAAKHAADGPRATASAARYQLAALGGAVVFTLANLLALGAPCTRPEGYRRKLLAACLAQLIFCAIGFTIGHTRSASSLLLNVLLHRMQTSGNAGPGEYDAVILLLHCLTILCAWQSR